MYFKYSNLALLFLSMHSTMAHAHISDDELAAYCTQSGGHVETMQAEFFTTHGVVQGFSKSFCEFHVDGGTLSIGLETFSSPAPSIAATYAKTLSPIDENSPLWRGNAGNPSLNVCKNLGGTSIGNFAMGDFTNEAGQSDICVFGDTSMISAWSLIYMANHRDGFDTIKALIRSIPIKGSYE